jgi:hypothetical protein
MRVTELARSSPARDGARRGAGRASVGMDFGTAMLALTSQSIQSFSDELAVQRATLADGVA